MITPIHTMVEAIKREGRVYRERLQLAGRFSKPGKVNGKNVDNGGYYT